MGRSAKSQAAAVDRRAFVSLGAVLLASGPGFAQTRPAPPRQALPFLRGVNFSGLTHEPGSQAPPLGACEYFLRQKRMNVVRLNFSWEFVQPVVGAALDAEACRQLDIQIERIAAAGAFVILELHNYGRRSVDGQLCVIGESQKLGSADFADVWRRMAERWRDHPKVLFALMNEPHDQNTAVLVEVSNAAIAAIRKAGSRQLVMVSGNGWNSMGWLPGSENRQWMLKIQDEADNFCFDVHHYFDDYSRGQTPNVRANPLDSLKAFTEWATANGKRAFCGEFGCHMNRRAIEACREMLNHIETHRDVYIGWAWWGAGGPWQPDYVFLLDPFASATSPTNPDPEGSIGWQRPVDRPQMKLLQEFLPKDATPFNAWLIEDQLGPRLRVSLRNGDYRAGNFGAEWLDSAARNPAARAGLRAGPEREDGSVACERAGQQLWIESVDLGQTEEVFAMAVLTDPAADRAVLGSETPSRRFVIPDQAASAAAGGQKKLWHRLISGSSGDASKAPGIVVGAADRDGNGMLGGRLYDLVIVTGTLSDADRARVQGRLHWDAGIAHLLPDGHPYRRRPPELRAA